MFDPLSSPFESSTTSTTPQWPSSPETQRSSSPQLTHNNHSRSVLPPSPTGPAGREPQIYGEPGQGLISPPSNGNSRYEKQGSYLRVRVTALDRNRRDIIIRMDAQTNLTSFTGNSYRGIARSYVEFQNFHSQLTYANPQTIIPALPLAQTSAPTDEEDDRIIKIMLQRWLTRICEDPVVLRDDELRSFIESEFGYTATPRPRRKTSTGFSLIRRAPPDEDEHLQQARFELAKLEGLFFDVAKAVDKVSRSRRVISSAQVELGNKLVSVATTEAHPPLGGALRKLGRVYHIAGDLSHAESMSECTILGDTFGYEGLNAKTAKETLQQRTQVLEEYQAAVKSSISKRRHIERLKASSNIRPDRVDEALEDLDEANKYEQILSHRVDGISNNLHRALQVHARQVDDDLTAALIEHARSAIMYEKQLLRELEALRPDFVNAAAPAASIVKKIPPTASPIIHPAPYSPPQAAQRFESPRSPPSSQTVIYTPNVPPSPLPHNVRPIAGNTLPPSSPGAGSSKSPMSPLHEPLSASSSTFSDNGPPLGGRFLDGAGTQSMFITSPSSPLHAQTVGRAQSAVLANTLAHENGHTDPLSQSMRIQSPRRNRLDAREAASKLANFL